MNLKWAKSQFPWVDLQQLEYGNDCVRCDKCGERFGEGEGWRYNNGGRYEYICDDCKYEYQMEQKSLARPFLDEDEKRWAEMTEWWFKGEDEHSRAMMLKELYMRYERNKEDVELEWASEDKYWSDFVDEQMEGERI